MTFPIRSLLLVTISGLLGHAQAPVPAAKPAQPAKPPASAKPAPAVKPRAARAPLTRPDIERLWKQQVADLLLNEITLRNLAFEPEEEWLAQLAKDGPMPAVIAELQKRIPPAPHPDEVGKVSADLIARLKTAAQARDENALKTVIHPELLAQKAKVYDLFDTTNYRDHVLGRFSAQGNRTVGAQFFQLTTSQVERLHYVTFATSYDKIVVRDVITGPAVAKQFLADETELAKSKMDLAFRAMNDGDESGLRNLCTPGLFEGIQELAGGARLTRGMKLTMPQVSITTSVPMDQKSIRVVARTMFTSPSGRRIEFDVDFERINNNLKIVRIRDAFNKVIAWDPDVDNYLTRRFGLPDGPRIIDPPQGKTELIQFQSLATIRQMGMNALLFDANAQKVIEFAQEMLESQPAGGEGHGLRASAYHLVGKYDEAERDATLALQRGGTVYFSALHHKSFRGQEFWPVVLAISKSKVVYTPAQGAAPEEIELSAIEKAEIESTGKLGSTFGEKARPFLGLKFKRNGKGQQYNFAATGTFCPVGATAPSNRRDLVLWTGGSVCPTAQNQTTRSIPGIGRTTLGPMYVPQTWQRNLTLIQRMLQAAGGGAR